MKKLSEIKRFCRNSIRFVSGPRVSLGTIVLYCKVKNRVDYVRFDWAKGEWLYALCGYNYAWFNEKEIKRMRV